MAKAGQQNAGQAGQTGETIVVFAHEEPMPSWIIFTTFRTIMIITGSVIGIIGGATAGRWSRLAGQRLNAFLVVQPVKEPVGKAARSRPASSRKWICDDPTVILY
uniref:Uncharacterized protein n=1 Tax=Anopheles atroparvus TaxID=41427 RepID=A0A182JBC2_ANOAO